MGDNVNELLIWSIKKPFNKVINNEFNFQNTADDIKTKDLGKLK
jgi:hypothetical protein